MSVPLTDQADEVELHVLGLRDQVERAEDKQIKRPAEWIKRRRARLIAAEAAARTLREIAGGQGART